MRPMEMGLSLEERNHFFHQWLREHQPAERSKRCAEHNCWLAHKAWPCEMRERAAKELLRDEHLTEQNVDAVINGEACCPDAEHPQED